MEGLFKMPTFPASLLGILDLTAILVFALSGALTASRQRLDVVGFVFLATVTGVGGGTLRDILLDRGPVFWIVDPTSLYVTTATAVIVFFTAHLVEFRYRLLLWADGLGLALYSVLGAQIALLEGASAAVCVLMGVVTATFGGLIRDVVGNETPLVLRRDIYWSASFAGAMCFVILTEFELTAIEAGIVGAALTFLIRALALVFDLSLPVYKPRQGRHYPATDR